MALSSAFDGAINGSDDPTQPKNRPAPAATPQKFFDPSASAASVSKPAPQSNASSVWDNFRPGAATGLDMPTFGQIKDSAQRADAAAQDKAASTATYGDPTKFTPGAPAPVDIRKPTMPVFSADSSATTLLNPLGRASSGAQPPVVRSEPAPPAASTPSTAFAPPGAAGRMAAAIPAVATTGPVTSATPADAGTGNTAAGRARAIADGGVVQPDGSIAFSDMKGKPGLLSQDKIAELAKVNGIPASSFTNPGLGVATSMATGGAVTPGVSADNVTRPVPQNDAYDRAQSDNLEAQRRAQSDLASIINKDPRSPLGIAARNAAVDAGSTFGTRTSRRIAYENAMGGMVKQALDGVTPQAQLGQEGVRDAGETARTGMQQEGDNQRAQAAQEGEDRRAQLNAATQMYDANIKRPVPKDDPAMEKLRFEAAKTMLGVDPVTGMITDKATGQKRPYTAKELQGAMQAASASMGVYNNLNNQAQDATQRPTATGKDGTKYSLSDDGKSWVKTNG